MIYNDGETNFDSNDLYNIITKSGLLFNDVVYEPSDKSFYTSACSTNGLNVRICHETGVRMYEICEEDDCK